MCRKIHPWHCFLVVTILGFKHWTVKNVLHFRKRKAQEEEEEEQKKKIQKEWDKNYEVWLHLHKTIILLTYIIQAFHVMWTVIDINMNKAFLFETYTTIIRILCELYWRCVQCRDQCVTETGSPSNVLIVKEVCKTHNLFRNCYFARFCFYLTYVCILQLPYVHYESCVTWTILPYGRSTDFI